MTARRFSVNDLHNSDLFVDAVYEGGRSGNSSDDPLTRLVGVSNQGGFRYLGALASPKLIVVTSTFSDADWPDNLDRGTGILTYYGDNKRPGRALHETPRHGNELLRDMFDAVHATPQRRADIPPVLVFGNAGAYRDMTFLGLAVPGAAELTGMEDLLAIWKIAEGQRFQNYRASFTILDVANLSRAWLKDIKAGQPLSLNCPDAWRNWVQHGVYKPLKAETTVEFRTKGEQLPLDPKSLAIINVIHDHFKDAPVLFEECATHLAKLMDPNFFSFDLTRPTRDGGRDATGMYRIGQGESAIFVDFALEAKCYSLDNSVGVRETSRLISRLKHREFGVLVTTSYLHSQAYQELKEDGHPVVVITARDIVGVLSKAGMNTAEEVTTWLVSNFPVGNTAA